MTNIVVPAKHPEIFYPCAMSLDNFARTANKVLVRDGKEPYSSPKAWDIATRAVIEHGWKVSFGPDAAFNYSRNMNIGIRSALTTTDYTNSNVILMNDDVRFMDPNTLSILEQTLERRPDLGIVSPRIAGIAGNILQRNAEFGKVHYSTERLAFICVLIRRAVIEDIGLLDEQFGEGDYGWDDVDYCLRAREAGWKLGVTGTISVKHGDDRHGSTGSSTFSTIGYDDSRSRALFRKKWGHNNLC